VKLDEEVDVDNVGGWGIGLGITGAVFGREGGPDSG